VKVKAPRDARALADGIFAAGGNIAMPEQAPDRERIRRSARSPQVMERTRKSWPRVGTR